MQARTWTAFLEEAGLTLALLTNFSKVATVFTCLKNISSSSASSSTLGASFGSEAAKIGAARTVRLLIRALSAACWTRASGCSSAGVMWSASSGSLSSPLESDV